MCATDSVDALWAVQHVTSLDLFQRCCMLGVKLRHRHLIVLNTSCLIGCLISKFAKVLLPNEQQTA